jgi:hypothetical protein
VYERSFDEDVPWQLGWHIGIVEFGKAERRLTQLAVLLVRVREPFHQAFLVNILNAAAAFAWVEERLLWCAFTAAYAAGGMVVFAGRFRGDSVFA